MSKISKIKKAARKITRPAVQQQQNKPAQQQQEIKSAQQQQKKPDNENIIIQVDELTHSIMESLINSESGNGSELDASVAEHERRIWQLETTLQDCLDRIEDLENELNRLKRR